MKQNVFEKIIYSVLIFTLFCMIVSCVNEIEKRPIQQVNSVEIDSSLIDANKYLKRSEDQSIDEFVKRYHWKMKKCNNGLRYWIYKEGRGKLAEIRNIVTNEYTLSLINGDTCYNSKE